MPAWRQLLKRLSAEHLGWFGAGLSTAAAGVVGYQFLAAALFSGPLPGLQAALPAAADRSPDRPQTPSQSPFPTRTPLPTWTPSPTHTPFPTWTPTPTRTPRPTSTPTPTRTSAPSRTPTPTRTPTPGHTPTAPVSSGVASVLATLTVAEPDAVVAVVATFAARTNAALEPLMTPISRR